VIPVALLVFYVAVVDRLGFVPTAALIIAVTALALGARLFAALALAVVTAPLAHLLFLKLLRVPLAPGLLPMPW
jgi:putative tricarboxylic transport membrane protein